MIITIGYALGLLLGILCVAILIKAFGATRLRAIANSLELKQQYVDSAVKYVQQKYPDITGEEKFRQAYCIVIQNLENIGINITEEQLEELIESAVRGFKDSFGSQWTKM